MTGTNERPEECMGEAAGMAWEPGSLSRQQVRSSVLSASRLGGGGPAGERDRGRWKLSCWAGKPLCIFLVLLLNGAS